MANDFPFLARLEILPAWEAATRRWLEVGGPVMVLGAPDTGKSTLSRYLVYRAYTAGLPVALMDLDRGQSHLGPPASLGLRLFLPSPWNRENLALSTPLAPEAASFVRFVKLGKLRLNLEGEELRHV